MNMNEVAVVVSRLAKLGITMCADPKPFKSFYGAWGSISNYKKVTLGEIRPVTTVSDEEVLAVFVKYEALSESGYDLFDFTETETRYVELSKLFEYLASKGIRERR